MNKINELAIDGSEQVVLDISSAHQPQGNETRNVEYWMVLALSPILLTPLNKLEIHSFNMEQNAEMARQLVLRYESNWLLVAPFYYQQFAN